MSRPYEVISLPSLLARSPRGWRELLRRPSLSLGLYALAPGADDPQEPHTEDEVYVVLEGRALLRVADDEISVAPGSLVFVAARVPHRFHSIEERLRLLVLFAPAESSPTTITEEDRP